MKIFTIAFLCILSSVCFGQSNTFCSANGSCTVTGAWSFSGPNAPIQPGSNVAFTGAIGRQSEHEINAALMTGADVCARAATAWTFATNLGWTGADVNAKTYTGSQACSVWMFTNFPYTAGNGASFRGGVTLGDINLLSDVSQIIPAHAYIQGNAWNNVGRSGTYIQASNAYATTTPKPLIQLGLDLTSGNTGTPPEGVQINNVNLDCDSPDGTHRAGMIGVLNGFAQENSGGRFIGVENCSIGFARRNLGSIGGAFNDGPYPNWHVRLNAREPTARCFVNGDDGSQMHGGRTELLDWSCNKGAGATQPTVGWQIDTKWETLTLRKMHGEGFVTCFDIGTVSGASGLKIEDSDCTALAGFNQTTVFHLSNAFPTNMNGIIISNGRPGGITTNLLVDDGTNGGTIPGTSQFDTLGIYVRDRNNQVFSTRAEIPSTFQLTINSLLSPSANFTTALANKTWTIDLGSATGSTNPYIVQDEVGDTGNGDLAQFVSKNGTSGHSYFHIQKQGVADLLCSRTGTCTFSTLVAATSGGGANSKAWNQCGTFWNGSVSAGDCWTWTANEGTGTNGTTIYTLTHSGSTGAKALDVTGAGTLQAGGGSAGKAVCWKADAKTLGFCSTVPDATGACTCN